MIWFSSSCLIHQRIEISNSLRFLFIHILPIFPLGEHSDELPSLSKNCEGSLSFYFCTTKPEEKNLIFCFWLFFFQPLGCSARYPRGISCRHSYRRAEWQGKVQIVGGRWQLESCHGHSWSQRNQNNIKQHLRGNTTQEEINWGNRAVKKGILICHITAWFKYCFFRELA